jgi:hypothetical protein
MEWKEAREFKTISDLTSEESQKLKSTLNEYHLFLLKTSNHVQAGLLDFMVFTRPEDLPEGIKHHPTYTFKELQILQQTAQGKFLDLWTNQERTPAQIKELIEEQFHRSLTLLQQLADYHLANLKNV